MSELDDIRARRAAITPGVWYVELRDASFYEGEEYVNAVVTTGDSDIAGLGAEEQCHAAAAFIAAAPADIDTLLASVAALTAERDALTAQLAQAQRELAQTTDERDEEWATRALGL